MADEDFRSGLEPRPAPGRWTSFRAAEYLLFQKNIRIPMTPGTVEECPGWMQTGFKIYRQLEELGFQDYPAPEARKQTLEVYPHGSFTVLLDCIPFKKNTLEGRLQRQLILHSRALAIPDPMRIFEEITRYRILQGVLPLEKLYSAGTLDALAAAYTARLAVKNSGNQVTRIGSPEEGEIILPSGELRAAYS
jgi:predicted RNase H-like nuclease